MTVGSFFRLQGNVPNFQRDLQMVKAALLYADHAKLVSMSSALLVYVANMFNVSPGDRLAFLKKIVPFQSEEMKKNLTDLVSTFEYASRRKYSKRGQEILKRLNITIAELFEKQQEKVMEAVSEVGGDGIIEAMDSGLLDVHSFGPVVDRILEKTISPDELMFEYINAASGALLDVQTYPVFDEETSEIIKDQVEEGRITPPERRISRTKEVALAADLLQRLPLFELATVREVLDIRRELEKPLRNFRSAMIKFSNQIESAPWDKDFADDAEQVFRSEVAPAVIALEDEEKSNSFLNKLTTKVAEKSLQVGGAASASAAISALAVRMLNLPLADVAALAAGSAIVAGGVAYSAYKEWREQQQKTEGNSLFFYYKAGTLLENSSFEYEDSSK